ncbi:alkylmercury lyase [Actinophytocola sp. NPDC049390]|uniref:alkylmercury lyase n=1 Tax=Actinophytocola sp. NPDC049390 TaxID=3363894 RepID=UPI0037AA4674
MSLTIELWHVPGCPLVDQVRATLQECLRTADIHVPVHERQGAYPSPTLVINGIDVVTGTTPSDSVCCRLDLPTRAQIHTALGERPAG